MKISPLAQGSGVPAGSEVGAGRSANPERIQRAKQAAQGLEPNVEKVNPVEEYRNDMKRIKMNTQRSVYRDLPVENIEEVSTESNIVDEVEPAQVTTEDTRPLSPQFAALAKAKRALQVKEREIQAREQALSQNPSPAKTDDDFRARLKANPLSVLQEEGVTYDQLTEAILSNQQEQSPHLQRLESELKALKEGLENQNKTQTERDEAAKQQVLTQLARDADQIIAQGDEYEMIRETGSRKEVIRLIEETFNKTGEVLDLDEALKLVEDELIEESLKIARIKKVQGRLTPPEPEQIQTQVKDNNVRVMRTLTNRDGASVPTTRQQRAIAAFHGRKI